MKKATRALKLESQINGPTLGGKAQRRFLTAEELIIFIAPD